MITRAPFRGTTLAGALLFDVRTIGAAEARRRVLAYWRDGSTLRALPDGTWLLTLPEPLSLRGEFAPGLPLVKHQDGWSAPGLPADRETITFPQAGEVVSVPLAATSAVDMRDWVDLSNLTIHQLKPLDQAPEVAQIPIDVRTTTPDLRKAAKLGRPSAEAAAFLAHLTRASDRTGAGEEGRAAVAQPGWFSKLWREAVWRSPAGNFLGRAQQRYFDQLVRKFERREFDQALRDAIGLGGEAGTGLAGLRLPRPRTSIKPGSSGKGGGGSSIPVHTSAFAKLKELYSKAARELEKAGRIEEAAFVYADLLNDTRAAVDLLERHDRLRLAAELAESNDLEAPLVVRLWWLAGDRARAIEVARSRGAFTTAIERLHAVDPTQARNLRIAWIQYCRDAGDPVATVDAAWPDATLRSTVLTDIATGIAMGGPRAAYLFAHLATERPTPANLERSAALLESDDLEARRRFTSALVGLRSTDRGADKQLATAALRSLLREGSTNDDPGQRAVAVLRGRCDPLVRADLPPLRDRSIAQGSAVDLTLQAEPGALPISDAAALRGGAVLVAHGDHGVRLLTHDGRTKARWDLPVHSLVVADHGGSALLVTRSASLQTIHRLDLATRSVRRWATLPPWRLLPSYDGGLLTMIDDDGFAFVDTLSERPKTLWRELDALHGIVEVNRTPELLTALVTVMPANSTQEAQIQLLAWELPSMTLRLRRVMEPDAFGESQVVLPSTLVVGGATLTAYRQREAAEPRELPHRRLLSSGSALGLGVEGELTIEVDGRTTAVVHCPATPMLRHHDGLVTVWTDDGRIAVVDAALPKVLANFRTVS